MLLIAQQIFDDRAADCNTDRAADRSVDRAAGHNCDGAAADRTSSILVLGQGHGRSRMQTSQLPVLQIPAFKLLLVVSNVFLEAKPPHGLLEALFDNVYLKTVSPQLLALIPNSAFCMESQVFSQSAAMCFVVVPSGRPTFRFSSFLLVTQKYDTLRRVDGHLVMCS